jgi:hypothetical protein
MTLTNVHDPFYVLEDAIKTISSLKNASLVFRLRSLLSLASCTDECRNYSIKHSLTSPLAHIYRYNERLLLEAETSGDPVIGRGKDGGSRIARLQVIRYIDKTSASALPCTSTFTEGRGKCSAGTSSYASLR